MQVLVAVLFLGTALAAAPSKLSVFVPEDAATAFDPAAILNHPMFIIAKKAPGSVDYKTAAVITGLAGPDIKEDVKYKAITDFLYSPGDKVAVYTDAKKFYSKALFDIPLPAGDSIIVPKDFKVEHFKMLDIPILFVTEPADFDKLKMEKLKVVAAFEMAAGDIKLIH